MTSRRIMTSSVQEGEGYLTQDCVNVLGNKATKSGLSLVMLLDLSLNIKTLHSPEKF